MKAIYGKTAVLVMHNIKPVNGGLTYSMMMRAEALAKISKVVVFTFGFDSDWHNSLRYWKNKLNNFENINFINIFEKENAVRHDLEMTKLGKDYSKFVDKNNPYGYRIFVDGTYRRYESYHKSNKIDFIDHFRAPWTRVSKSVFSRSGARIVEHMMNEKNKISFSAYYTSLGSPVYSCVYDHETGQPANFFDHLRN